VDNLKIASVTTLKAPLDITLSFIRYHLNTGIDHMYLFFDDPLDEAISKVSDNDRVSIFICDKNHWEKFGVKPNDAVQIKQEANATHAFHLAHDDGFEWLIHIDSDELIYGKTSLKKHFQKMPDYVDVVRFPVMESSPQQLDYENSFTDINYFRLFTALPSQVEDFFTHPNDKKDQEMTIKIWTYKSKIAKALGSKNALRKKFLFGHVNGKAAIRTSAAIEKVYCHLPKPKDGETLGLIVSDSYFLLHYDCMGFTSWKYKWSNRINGDHKFTHGRLSKFRVDLEKEIENALSDDNKLKSLYKNLYTFSSYEYFLLKSLGLIRKVVINPKLFEKG